MKYLADTIADYIINTGKKPGTFKFILPSYPADILLEVGEKIETHHNNIIERKTKFIYGIAYRLGKEWQESGDASTRAIFNLISHKGWHNQENNLTSLRNAIKPAGVETLITLLAGYEDIDDKGGLGDFFHLDQDFVWKICLKKSFKSWLESILKEWINLEDHAAYIRMMDELFSSIYNSGLGDLVLISRYLENHDFSGVSSGSEAYTIILEGLEAFALPRMTGLKEKRTVKSFSTYQSAAIQFFNYSSFLKTNDRIKVLEKIKKYYADDNRLEPGEEELGDFATVGELVEGLKDYIDNRNEDARQKLYSVDFIYLYEKVLDYKPKKEKTTPKKISVRKVKGVAPEVFLHALWLTWGDLRKTTRAKKNLPGNVKQVVIRSVLFKHDFNAGENEDEHILAKDFLHRVLGGLDEYLSNLIRIPRQDDKHERPAIIFDWQLSPNSNNEYLEYAHVRTGEPNLKFEIIITYGEREIFKREFLWALPKNHQTRLMDSLYNKAREFYLDGNNMLPVFTIPYIEEIFIARDEDECTHLLQSALQKQKKEKAYIDLLELKGLEKSEILRENLEQISYAYQNFLKEINKKGFFATLNVSYQNLGQKLNEAYKTFIDHSTTSVAGSLLWKAFMLVSDKKHASGQWVWEEYLDAAIITPLHPVLLEMMRYQYSFLCDSFCFYVEKALARSDDKLFAEKYWYKISDLSTIQWPVLGTLVDYNQTLNTDVRSFGYFHLVGKAPEATSFLNSQILFEYEDEDEEISDGDLFRETQASLLIKQIIMDYIDLHPFATDGITIGAYSGSEIQPVIAGIDAFLTARKDQEKLFALSINIFSDSRDDSLVMSWINAWKDKWQAAELSTNMKHYNQSRISIAYRVVSKVENPGQFKKLLQETELDIMFFCDFINLIGSRFEIIDNQPLVEDYRRFPVLEKSSCKRSGGGQDYKRERLFSNQRFPWGANYTEVMARLKNKYADARKRHVVISNSDYEPWLEIVDEAHAHSTWVVCIDPSIDEELLLKNKDDDAVRREIVGFGTGVGAHGENNYTISTEHFLLNDISKKISSSIGAFFTSIDKSVADAIAASLLREALHVAGLSIIKATGAERYVREFIANTLVRKLLTREPDCFCDAIFSLDAFLHWFDNPNDRKRPDLLRIKATIVNGYFNIEAQIVECKLAQQSEGYIQDAREQIENGLNQLIMKFQPRNEARKANALGQPDQRYWWLQLHRLIASKGNVSMSQYEEALLALERLSEGLFNITWQAAVVAIWVDIDNDECHSSPEWIYEWENNELDICLAQIGKAFLPKVCLEDQGAEIFVGNKKIEFKYDWTFETLEDEEIDIEDKDFIEIKVVDLEEDGLKQDADEKAVVGSEFPENKTIAAGGSKINQKSDDTFVEISTYLDRILLGQVVGTKRNVYWEFGHEKLTNRHLLIFGASGTGKTYAIQALMYELAKYKQNSLIVDYTNGFTTNQLESVIKEVLKPQQYIVRREPLPINPFRRQVDTIEGFEIPEDPASTAQRVSGVFAGIYQLGDQQKAALYMAIRDGVEKYGEKFNFATLMQGLGIIADNGGPTATSANSVKSKIQPFVDTNPFGIEDPQSWDRLFSDQDAPCHIIQLAGFMKDFAHLITDFALIDLYRYYRALGDKAKPRVIILDEIQNLDHKIESPLAQFLTEGRKFGVSLILATQTLSNLGKDERDRLFQASHKLFFKPADTEIRFFAGLLADATGDKSEEWISRLATLKQGECYSLGFALNDRTGELEPNKWFKIKISELKERLDK